MRFIHLFYFATALASAGLALSGQAGEENLLRGPMPRVRGKTGALVNPGQAEKENRNGELAWAQEVVEDFFASYNLNTERSLILCSPEFIKSLPGPIMTNALSPFLPNYPLEKVTAKVTSGKFSPNSQEAIFLVSATTRDAESGKLKQKLTFKVRLVKANNGLWQIRFLDGRKRKGKNH